jgi:hypothetical protein
VDATLRAEDLYHTGVVVPDLEAAMARLSAVTGVAWTRVLEGTMTIRLASGDRSMDLRYAYTLDAPYVEFVQAVPGTPWEPSASGAAHHVGYFCDDLAATSAALAERGFAREACGVVDDEIAVFAFHRDTSGVRLEILERARIPDFPAHVRSLAASTG